MATSVPLTPWPPAALYPAALLSSSLMKDNSETYGQRALSPSTNNPLFGYLLV
jgi:hypothetical protein